ncbi:hypothetical protein THAOC_01247 [Thalassiosira oceanica]|uniref:Uncharacterized protein n=1 Tax=Thalassiosira oceanica TaxID=159749 RepID=K0TE13_THAOC|nr:hypothetical protein THAOC_01247 [Thalassiosira oceanica]|eukprot:EJK76958.1 hypothetical protein THAOC_01247 [Thalassiosira oceanica]
MGTLDVEFGVVNADNVEQVWSLEFSCHTLPLSLYIANDNHLVRARLFWKLKKIDQACFPVTYNQKYYDGLVKKPDEDLVKFAYFGGLAVGAIATRIEDIPKR